MTMNCTKRLIICGVYSHNKGIL
uniref:Uncharacterized protein n=1 Tax=Anguilla anguilla TaxID=7936 RepID=A0A0E9SJX0_ANGAN